MQSLSIVIRTFLRSIVYLKPLLTAVPSKTYDVGSYVLVKMTLMVPVPAIYLLDSFMSINVVIIAAVIVR